MKTVLPESANISLFVPDDVQCFGKQLGKAFSSNNMGDGPPKGRGKDAAVPRPVRLKQAPVKYRVIEVVKSPQKSKGNRGKAVVDAVHAITGIASGYNGCFEIKATWDCHDGTGTDGVKDYWTPATDTFHIHEMLCDYLDNQHDVPAGKASKFKVPNSFVHKIVINKDPMIQSIRVYFEGQADSYDALKVCMWHPRKITEFFKANPVKSGNDSRGFTFTITEDPEDGFDNSQLSVDNDVYDQSLEDVDSSVVDLQVDSASNSRDAITLLNGINSGFNALPLLPVVSNASVLVNDDGKHDDSPVNDDSKHDDGSDGVFTNTSSTSSRPLSAVSSVPKPQEKVAKVFIPLTSLPLTDEDIQLALIPCLATLYVKSRALQKLKPFSTWHSDQKGEWRKILTKHLLWLDKELKSWENSKCDLHLLNIVLT